MNKLLDILSKINFYLAIALILIISLYIMQLEAKEPIKVMVIDSYLDLSNSLIKKHYKNYKGSYKPLSSDRLSPPDNLKSLAYINHGTHVASIVLSGNLDSPTPVCDNVELYFCNIGYNINIYPDGSVDSPLITDHCINEAMILGVEIINISLSGPDRNEAESQAISKAINKGIKIVVSLGNTYQKNIKDFKSYPATLHFELTKSLRNDKGQLLGPYVDPIPNFMVVKSVNQDGKLSSFSADYDLATSARGEAVLGYCFGNETKCRMNGTSQAAALVTNREINKMCNRTRTEK